MELICSFIENLNITKSAEIILSLTAIFIIGYIFTRLTRLIHLPDATGYILSGILIGPYVLDIIPQNIYSNLYFVADIALGFIAFGVGQYFTLEKTHSGRTRIFVITLCESLLTLFIVVFTMRVIFKFDLAFSFLLGSIACATAPASTIMTIRQYKAKGPFITTLLKVIAIDDCIAILLFHMILPLCVNSSTASDTLTYNIISILQPLIYNIILIVLGIIFGLLASKILVKIKSSSQKLLTGLLFLLVLITACSILETSPLLACMAFGASYNNIKGDRDLFDAFSKLSPPFILFFFVYSGMKLNIYMLTALGIIGTVYFLIRIIAKICGAYIGGQITYASNRIKKYIGFALIPQASVAIGLTTLACRYLPQNQGDTLSVIVISSAVLYELIGPLLSKFAIFKSKSIPATRKNNKIVIEETPLQDIQTNSKKQNTNKFNKKNREEIQKDWDV